MAFIQLYDLEHAASGARPSPFCWLVKFGLLHKGLDFQTRPLGFLPKSDYPDPDYGRVPVLEVDGRLVRESEDILLFIDEKWPEPPLTDGPEATARATHFKGWVMQSLFPGLAPMILPRVHHALPEHEREFFREKRERAFGMTLEAMLALEGLDKKVEAAMAEPEGALGDKDFFGGTSPDLTDYRIASPLMWQHSITREPLYPMPTGLAAWFDRLRNHFDGYAAKSPCVDVRLAN